VDPILEITEFADRSVKSGGPALLFEHPKGSSVPVLINAFASMRRMEIALKVESVNEVAARITNSSKCACRRTAGKLKMLPKLAEMGAFFPKVWRRTVPGGRENDGFSLYDYPVLTCWPGDGGPFITLPMVFSRNPDTGKRNCGITGCRSTTSARRECTGRRTNRVLSIIGAGWPRQVGAHGRRGGDWFGPRDDVFGDPAAAARSG